jgi:ribosomal protein L6P/L9E
MRNIINYYRRLFSIYAPYVIVLMIRGIGYRASIVYNNDVEYFVNDLMGVSTNDAIYSNEDDTEHEAEITEGFFSTYYHSCQRYILIRAGYSLPTYTNIFDGVGIRTLRRDRKVICYSFNKECVTSFVNYVYMFRPPNAFTGRGIKYKGVRFKVKPGKRGSIKGRIW